MIKGILKPASEFREIGHNYHELRSIHFGPDTKLPNIESSNKFVE